VPRLDPVRRLSLVWIAALLVAGLPVQAPAAVEAQVREIGQRLVCYCGCSGLTVSACTCGTADRIRETIRAQLDSGLTPEEVVDAWVAERGEQILAVPTREGFNLVGWILPFVVTALGVILLSALLLRRRRHFEETSPASEELPEADASYLERIERDVRDLQV
jgi:cytochrome c-type biogenesis protein CcmH